MTKRTHFVFLLLFFLFSIFLLAVSETLYRTPKAEEQPSLMKELADIYTRYSFYLDTQWTGNGWNYEVPSQQYNEVNRNSENDLRLGPTFAIFYLFRKDGASKEKIHKAIVRAYIELPQKQANAIPQKGKLVSTRSFNEIIGMYLALEIVQRRPEVFTPNEKQKIIYNIKEMYPWALKANDTENRAFLGAAYGVAIIENSLLPFSNEEKDMYVKIIKDKVLSGLESIDENYYYKEGANKEFSLHYHLVSSDMLYYIGSALNDEGYKDISKKMAKIVHDNYPLGKLHVNGSKRPKGIGLQTIFLRALSEKFSGNSNWQIYWDQEKNGYGFIDPANPNRLAWRDEEDDSYNDDYSFANMGELFKDFIN